MTDLDTMKADMAVLADTILCCSRLDQDGENALQRLHDYLSARLAGAEQPAVAGDGGLRGALEPLAKLSSDAEWDDVPDHARADVVYRSEAGGEESVGTIAFADFRRARATLSNQSRRITSMTAQERDFLTAPIDDVGYVDFAPSKRVKEFSADEQAIYKMLKGYGVYDHLDGAGEYLDNDISLADDLKAWIADTIADYDRRVASIIAERDQWQTRAEERDGWLEKCLTRTRWLTSQRGEQRNLPDVWLWHHTDTEYVPGMVPPDAEDIAEGWSAVRYIAAPPTQDPTR